MFPRVDFGHLYKFIASSGLALMAAAVAIPWLVLQNSSILLISREQINGLTTQAADLIERKQAQMSVIVAVYPWFSLFIGVLGIGLLLWGFFGWRSRQQVLDQKEDLALMSDALNYRRLSESESVEKARAEAVEKEQAETGDADGDALDDADDHGDAGNDRPGSPTDRPGPVSSEAAATGTPQSAIVDRIRRAEIELSHLIRRGLENTHRVEQDVLVGAPGSKIVVDLLALPTKAGQAPIVFEVKLVGSQRGAAPRAREALNQLAAATSAVSITSTRAVGIAVFVITSEVDFASFDRILHDAVSEFRLVYDGPIAAVAVTEFEVDVRAARIAERINAAIGEAGKAWRR